MPSAASVGVVLMRAEIPDLIDVHSILWAALSGAAALLATDAILSALFNAQGAWQPCWVLASVFMGQVVLHWPAVFDFGAITAALAALFPFCFCYTLILALVVLPWIGHSAGFVGAAFGMLCYLPSHCGFSLWRPWLVGQGGWILFVGHLTLGLVATNCLLYRSRANCN